MRRPCQLETVTIVFGWDDKENDDDDDDDGDDDDDDYYGDYVDGRQAKM